MWLRNENQCGVLVSQTVDRSPRALGSRASHNPGILTAKSSNLDLSIELSSVALRNKSEHLYKKTYGKNNKESWRHNTRLSYLKIHHGVPLHSHTTFNLPRLLHSQLATSLLVFGDVYTGAWMNPGLSSSKLCPFSKRRRVKGRGQISQQSELILQRVTWPVPQ